MAIGPSIWNKPKTKRFQDLLLAWYRRHRRRLPWRRNRTPYRVWVAEIMLQQTRVQAAIPFYDRFLARFPTLESLAAASEADVLELWAGLGYYQRARNLRKAAKQIVEEQGGKFPGSPEDIRRLPGVGRYTAGAIYSIAFDRPEPVVDGNVRRVICRTHGIAEAPEEFFWEQAEAWLAQKDPSDFNQAVMELGALICVPSRPLCGECPVETLCYTGRAGWVPPARGKLASAREAVEMVLLVLACEERVVLMRKPEAGFIPGEWGLPGRIVRDAESPRFCAGRLMRGILGEALPFRECRPVRHAITRRDILAHVYCAEVDAPPPDFAPRSSCRWHSRGDLARILTSSLYRKALRGYL